MFSWFKKKDQEKNKMVASAKIPSDVKMSFPHNVEYQEKRDDNPIVSPEKKEEVDVKVASSLPNDFKDNTPRIPSLGPREFQALKRASYEKNATKFNNSYVLKNKKTGQIAEIRAASSFHACNIIGWKPNRVTLIEERKIEAKS